MAARVWRMVKVVERFSQPKEYGGHKYEVRMERLSCGHIRKDPVEFYSNETSFKIKRVFEMVAESLPPARCYECGRDDKKRRAFVFISTYLGVSTEKEIVRRLTNEKPWNYFDYEAEGIMKEWKKIKGVR